MRNSYVLKDQGDKSGISRFTLGGKKPTTESWYGTIQLKYLSQSSKRPTVPVHVCC